MVGWFLECHHISNGIFMRTRQKQKCTTSVCNSSKTRYTPVKRDRKLPAFPYIPFRENKPQKRDTRLKNESGVNFGNSFLEEGKRPPTPKTRFSIWTLPRTPVRFTTRPLPVYFTTKMSVVRPFFGPYAYGSLSRHAACCCQVALSAPKSQRFFAIAMPIADPRNRAISETREKQ